MALWILSRLENKVILAPENRSQSLQVGGFPFEVRLDQPNKETMAAMLEAERIAHDPSVKHYTDVEEALRELKR